MTREEAEEELNRRFEVALSAYPILRGEPDPERWHTLAAWLLSDDRIFELVKARAAAKPDVVGRRTEEVKNKSDKRPAHRPSAPAPKHSISELEKLFSDFSKFERHQIEKANKSSAARRRGDSLKNAFLDDKPHWDKKLHVVSKGETKRISRSRFYELIKIGKNASKAIWHHGEYALLSQEALEAYNELRGCGFSLLLVPIAESDSWIVNEIISVDPLSEPGRSRLLELRLMMMARERALRAAGYPFRLTLFKNLPE